MDTLKKLKGIFSLEIRDTEGQLKEKWEVENLVTNAGFAQLALLAGDASATPFTYLAVGTSSTAPNVADTTLTAEITDTGLERVAGTVSRVTTTVTNDTYQIAYVWTATGSKTVEEIGVFNASSAGTMLCHALTTSKSLSSGESLSATYKLKFA
jgi:hypothetical protein